MITNQQAQVIAKCKKSCVWFLRNFCKVKHPKAGVLQFDPFKYQINAIKTFRENRFVIFRKTRQAGISKLSGAFALWFAMFSPHKRILIVSKSDDSAMDFLRENIKFVFENLPKWMQDIWYVKGLKNNDHELEFTNGSLIKSVTSAPDVLRSNASSLNIIDEAAFIPDMSAMWTSGYSCTVYDTLIQTDEGLIEVGSIGDSTGCDLQDIGINVQTDNGICRATKYKISDIANTIVATTEHGYEIEGSDIHNIRIIDEAGDYAWRQLNDVKCGDIVPSMPNIFNGKRRWLNNIELDEDVAELLGFYIGDGSLNWKRPKRFRIYFDPQDEQTCDYLIDKLNSILQKLNITTSKAYKEYGDHTVNLRLNNAEFIHFLLSNNLNTKKKPQLAEIPSIILRSDRDVICAFLRGLFDTDGWCYHTGNHISLGLSSCSEKLIKQVQIVLHSLGILSTRRKLSNTKGRFSKKEHWKLTISDTDSKIKFRSIGFRTIRKQNPLDSFKSDYNERYIKHDILVADFIKEALNQISAVKPLRSDCRVPNLRRILKEGRVRVSLAEELINEFDLKCKLAQYIKRGFCFDIISSIRSGTNKVYDLHVPDNNTYISNGFISHNTLMHGGSCIVISTTNGIGDWYWGQCIDADAGTGIFKPLIINWWDMDWKIEYHDDLSHKMVKIEPRAGIRECTDPEEIEKYGPYWSPWLEEQYQALMEQGESWKFDQEVMAKFVGSGNTVLPVNVLNKIQESCTDDYKRVVGTQSYIHSVTGESIGVDFTPKNPGEGLWIFKEPVRARPPKKQGNKIIDPGVLGHSYVIGVDLATGKGRDYNAIEVFDVDAREQVAEMMVHCTPLDLRFVLDYIGRWYNTALLVIERNNGGDIFVEIMKDELRYPKLWRKIDVNDKPNATSRVLYGHYGFMTNMASKPALNKYLLNYLRADGEGVKIYSRRLHKQLSIYIRKKTKSGQDTNKTEAEDGPNNHDDLVMATGLAFAGFNDAINLDPTSLIPTRLDMVLSDSPEFDDIKLSNVAMSMMAFGAQAEPNPAIEVVDPVFELEKFTRQMIPQHVAPVRHAVVSRRHKLG